MTPSTRCSSRHFPAPRRRRRSNHLVAGLVVLGLSVLSGCADDGPDADIPREPFPGLEEDQEESLGAATSSDGTKPRGAGYRFERSNEGTPTLRA